METQHQYSQNQEAVEKLRIENVELKKNLEREQHLHTMLYKEWKELNAQVLSKEHEVLESKPKNLFYKYAFYVLLIAAFPAYYFITTKKNPSSQTTSVPTRPANIRDSTPVTNSALTATNSALTTNKKPETIDANTVHQPALKQPVVKTEEKRQTEPRTIEPKIVPPSKAVPEGPLTDSIRDLIYWQGWNAYYDRSPNHFKKTSQKYQVWLQGFNEGKNDAKKLLAKDTLQKQR